MSAGRRAWLAGWVAACTWVGALVARPAPLWVLVVVAGLGGVLATLRPRTWRRPLIVVAVLLLPAVVASHRSAAEIAGQEPVPPGHVAATVVVTEDPQWFGGSLRLVVARDGQKLEVWARGASGAALSDRLVGERVALSGSVAPMRSAWRLGQGVVGRVDVDAVGPSDPGAPVAHLANGLRRTLAEGASAMDPDDAALYAGLVLGDRRAQDDLTEDSFQGAGLTHVLAVSGSNVAFVLVLAGPLLRRLRFGGRLVATLLVLAFFAVVTRLEPSVLRASTMAALGTVAVTFGWEVESRAVLGVTVVLLLLVDPGLARSVGFQLSVAASLGILLMARPVASALRGPRWFVDPLSVTIAAQLAVAPVLLPIAGGLPVASVPANLLAVPATGPIMVWGFPAGLLAGLAGGDSAIAQWLHGPTRLLVSWVSGVATTAARLPLGQLGVPHLVAVVVLGVVGVAASRKGVRVLVGGALVGVALQPAVALAMGGGPPLVELGTGAVAHRGGGAVVVVLEGSARSGPVLDGLRRAGIRRVDVVVAIEGGRSTAEVVALLDQRVSPRLVLAPSGHRVPGGSTPPTGAVVTAGGLAVHVLSHEPVLEVEVRPD